MKYEGMIECLICKKQLKHIFNTSIVNVEEFMAMTNWGWMNLKTNEKRIRGWVCDECLKKLGVV
ncbi:MAG: hypothetical protein QW228_02890 [Candidatus Aenigmatarchaeota archaeon]